jgi:hypothetical protein
MAETDHQKHEAGKKDGKKDEKREFAMNHHEGAKTRGERRGPALWPRQIIKNMRERSEGRGWERVYIRCTLRATGRDTRNERDVAQEAKHLREMKMV